MLTNESARRGRLIAVIVGVVAVVVGAGIFIVTRPDDGASNTNLRASAARSTSTSRPSTTVAAGLDATTSSSTQTAVDVTTTTAAPVAQPLSTAPSKPQPTAPPKTQPRSNQATGACNSGAGSAAANRLANLYCSHRSNNGLPIMRRTNSLDNAAHEWANQMAQSHQVPPPHSPNNQAQVLAGCSACTGWGENVGYWEADQPDSIWQAWLNSSAHRSNIEDSASGEYGIGVAYSSDGWLWVVQTFGFY